MHVTIYRLIPPAALGALLLVAFAVPAAAQCNGGGMMGMCSGGENCHDPGQACTSENCPGGMMGSCHEDSTCNTGMMGSCHEDSGSSGCPMMEECEMGGMMGECEMGGMMGECEMGGMMGECENMEECQGDPMMDRRARAHVQLSGSPNPFNPVTTLFFTLEDAAQVDLRIYDTAARPVAQLLAGPMDAGNHTVAFSAWHLPAGVYFARLQVGQTASLQKLVLLK